MIDKQAAVHTTTAGESVDAYTLAAGTTRARILTLGGTITHLHVPDRDGRIGDVVLGFDDVARYQRKDNPYFGCIIGRVGNRIAGGKFTLDGKTYTLATNNGPNHLHGGVVGYGQRVWKAEAGNEAKGPTLKLSLRDPDRFEGYPGTLDIVVTYTLRDNGTLRIDYAATALDKSTPVNLTNHSYFNLRDAGATTNHDHVVELDAERYTPVDATLIPTGTIDPVAATPFDFTLAKPIGREISMVPGAAPGGYDHNYVLRSGDGQLARAARVVEPTSGRTMECWTTEPGVQFYSGNFLDGTVKGKNGTTYHKHAGFCLETQKFPDGVNRANFPDTVLRAGQTYRSTTEYRFGVE